MSKSVPSGSGGIVSEKAELEKLRAENDELRALCDSLTAYYKNAKAGMLMDIARALSTDSSSKGRCYKMTH